MGERKVLNKYYPPDFDPAKIPRRRQPKNQQMKVRMMLPMSIRCSTCGNYIYKGTKFNSRKEDVIGEVLQQILMRTHFVKNVNKNNVSHAILFEALTYLGIQIFRFYFKCTKCSSEITYKTDPKNSDYVVESGATRNFEPWRAEDEEVDKEKRKRDAEEMGDAMKSLENRTLDSKQEMDIIAALDEMKSMKSRQASVSVDAMLEVLQQSKEDKERKLNEEDEALIKSIFKGSGGGYVRRIDDEDIDDDYDELAFAMPTNEPLSKRTKLDHEEQENPTDVLIKANTPGKDKADVTGSSNGRKFIFGSSTITVAIKQKPPSHSNMPIEGKEVNQKAVDNTAKEVKEESADNSATGSTGLQSLCQLYDSEEDD